MNKDDLERILAGVRRRPADQFRQLLHPLCGADLTTLLGVLVGSGGVARQHLLRAGIALTVAIIRWPFSTVEGAVTAVLRRRSTPTPPPLFIVGHWRSGTTHLYNVLSRSPAFSFVPPIATGLPWDMLGLARLLRPLLERALPLERFVDSLPVRPDSPQEDEIALANMQPLSFYHEIYFPRRLEERFRQGVFFDGCGVEAITRWRRRHVLFLEKLALLQPGRRLLIKTRSTARAYQCCARSGRRPNSSTSTAILTAFSLRRAPSTPGCCGSSRCSGSSLCASTT